ncbi:glycosyl hydrolase 115 family protein [Mucilaginibacter arboris]|uniref:Gylcosyl hydrolase 115 C-terminal domain-containing protein n=1 Tax=Mucilaginibacter arboris TaxID=2682090 RepID=A0A7K1SU85_9SPHI|nr:glycosyl hydrolase 115 family protein [Mucilaginibacter arboris]MVN20817.1 hypothetical protein [Mucilaginibacter arboris]
MNCKPLILFFLPAMLLLPAKKVCAQKIAVSNVYQPASFPLVHQQKAASIYIDSKDAAVVPVAAEAFKNDLTAITGAVSEVKKDAAGLDTFPVIIGTLGQSKWIDALVKSNKIKAEKVRGKWETFSISVVDAPFTGIKKALVIFGSDRRGTAFGVFELSRMVGVSPLCWWADIVPEHQNALYISPGESLEGPPSVKYRGIFLNDEDWGLQPWAARNMDKEVKDIGPKTYTKIFELLLRMKANFIWPAMHPCTKAFYFYPDDPKIADQYAIVVGSSHCEPMLRNNVFEWAENFQNEYGQKPGEWRYDLNQKQIDQYWSDRIQQSKNYESVYTVGMRGIHDGSMPGPKDKNEKVKLLDKVITNQRSIFAADFTKPVNQVPQIFCPYKEVLSLYQAGLKLPDDVTIVWADDNHGYVRQLSNPQEQKRSGGSGVYYHISYWGAPQDYLWLCSTSPSLISYELSKAYQYDAKNLWVINVGDIKPGEMETQFSMDLAWNVNRWKPENASQYAAFWAEETFGKAFAKPIAKIKSEYYRLSQTAKPEHMNAVIFTDAAVDQRLKEYQAIAKEAEELQKQIPQRLQDAYFELIFYPVKGACLMNEKVLYAQKSLELAANGDKTALDFSRKSEAAFQQIQIITKKYNEQIAGGKWNGIMSWHPRDQEVFKMPKIATEEMVEEGKKLKVPTNSKDKTITIQAASFTTKKDAPDAKITTIIGLGAGGNGETLLPVMINPVDQNQLKNAAYLEYQVDLPKGDHRIKIKCLPTFGVYEGRGVRYAISVNDETPQVINVAPASENAVWKQNVLQGYASGETLHHLKNSGKNSIKIYPLDPGTVINQLEIR